MAADDIPDGVQYPDSYVVISIKRYYDLMEEDKDGNLFQSNPKNIPDGAYLYRGMLSELHFPDTETIGKNAFKMCTRIEKAEIPKVRSIGSGAFNGCLSLKELDLPELQSVQTGTFQSCSSLQHVNAPKVTEVKANGFQDCESLEEISMLLATGIGDYSFRGCKLLKEFEAPNVSTIGAGAFYGCSSLEELFLPKASSIGESAFAGCDNLKQIHLPFATELTGENIFAGCGQLEYLNLQSITSDGLPENSLAPCENLQWLNLHSAVPSGSVEDFISTCGLTAEHCSVICQDNVIKYADEKTPGDFKQEDIFTYSNEVQDGVQVNCLQSVKTNNVPDKIKDGLLILTNIQEYASASIKQNAFMGQKNIEKVFMPTVMYKIEANAFKGCKNLKMVDFPMKVISNAPQYSMADSAFNDCPNLMFVGLSAATAYDVKDHLDTHGKWGLPNGCVIVCGNGMVKIDEEGNTYIVN